MKQIIRIVIFIALFAVASLMLYRIVKPNIQLVSYTTAVYELDTMSVLLDDDRHCGYINLNKFIQLASKHEKSVFDSTAGVVKERDSITFSTSTPKIFFGVDGGSWWKKKYKQLPISFHDAYSFTAKVEKINHQDYIYIPYEILSCLASSFNVYQQNSSSQVKSFDKEITLKSQDDLNNLTHDGSKIQTGGRVFEHVSDVLYSQGGKNKDNYDQLKILWEYANKHWMYITDPYTGVDTWRSATETIEAYYFSNDKGYAGDCDDFAILMASFARQLGFDSHVVAAFGDKGGHAYAEFKYGSKWIPLDWFSKDFGGTPYQAKTKIVLKDI